MTITYIGNTSPTKNEFQTWYNSWEKHYVPYLNPFRKSKKSQDIEFRTDERTLKILRMQNPRRVWSVVSTSEWGLALIEGFQEENGRWYYLSKYKRPRNSIPRRIQIYPDEFNPYIP